MRQCVSAGAPYERQHFALELLAEVLATWQAAGGQLPASGGTPAAAAAAAAGAGGLGAQPGSSTEALRVALLAPFQPFCSTLLSPETVQVCN
jgi:hypothetical protein